MLVINYMIKPSFTITRDKITLNSLRSVSVVVTNLLSLNNVLYGTMAHRTMLILYYIKNQIDALYKEPIRCNFGSIVY